MKDNSLTHRLVDRYLMYGLAGFLCFLVFSLMLAWQGRLTSLVSLAAVSPLAVLLAGCLAVRKTVRLHSQIETQLHRLAEASSGQIDLRPIVDEDPAAAGWNQLQDRVARGNSLEDLEDRLSDSLGGLRQRRLEDALNSLSDAVAVTDVDGLITYANRSFASILGLPPEEEVCGRSLHDALAAAAPDALEQLTEHFRQTVSTRVFELERENDTSTDVLRIERSRINSKNNQATGWVCTIRDVTQQKLAEEMRNQFVFTATHELRTPLTSIKAGAETLAMLDDIDVEQQKHFCNIINEEATRLSRFVDELLNVSQMESGALALARRETDVARLLEDVVKHVQPEIERKRIEFGKSLPPKLSKMQLDKDKITAALVNLLGNAVKYTPEEGRVNLCVQALETNLIVQVEDGGIGIAEDEQAKIFEKFFRSDDDRVREITGSGLGLAFTNEVVRLHRGQLTVESELDKGSTFTMQLPLG